MKAYINYDWIVIFKSVVVDDIIGINSCSFGFVFESLSPCEEIRRILKRFLTNLINLPCKMIIRAKHESSSVISIPFPNVFTRWHDTNNRFILQVKFSH